jgi:hypothetical protein
MNAADRALAQGFATLTATAGDAVVFRGRALSAVIDWRPFDERNPDNGLPDFTSRETSRIQFQMDAVQSAPVAGEIIRTGSVNHRIQKVFGNGSEWVCDCEVSR